MTNPTIKEPFYKVFKQVRDDMEDGKLDHAIKEIKEQNPALFLKAAFIEKQTFLPPSEK